jgi:hypothetical protein
LVEHHLAKVMLYQLSHVRVWRATLARPDHATHSRFRLPMAGGRPLSGLEDDPSGDAAVSLGLEGLGRSGE